MKSKIIAMTAIITLFAFSFSIPSVGSQPNHDAWFTHIYWGEGDAQVDLVEGGTVKAYVGNYPSELIIYNNGCGALGADLYYRVILNETPVITSSETYVPLGSSVTHEGRFGGPRGTVFYRYELWWNNFGEHLIVDAIELNVIYIELEVLNWTTSSLSIDRGLEARDLALTFTNGGNDYMYNVSISVVDSAGLAVSPQTQNLGNITEGDTKSAAFSISASRDATPRQYTTVFEIAYDDFRGVTHTKLRHAVINVTSNVIRENLMWILAAIIIVVGSAGVGVYYMKLRKPQKVKPEEPNPEQNNAV